MPVTISDVARQAGVSKTTVSRVLNAGADVDAATAARVREVIAALGYVPRLGAVQLARGRSRTVAMFAPSVTWPWMGEVLQGVADTVEAAGYALMLFTSGGGPASMAHFTAQVSARVCDGLLAIVPERCLPAVAELARRGTPVVLIDDHGHRRPALPSVGTTNRAGGAQAGAHLRAVGRSRPLVITGPPRFGCVGQRLEGFREQLPPTLVLEGEFTERTGRDAVEHALAQGVDFDAVFAHNDQIAAGALRALRAAGRTVPDDVAVVGFDDLPMARSTDPALTTVRQPMREMGGAAASLLLAGLGGTPLPDGSLVIPTDLVVRDSA
ncbi:LacI family DNA-binding transcriptional regulator [Streptomyces sp. TLI_171]|uniref:LacI family DNA-binding transcriptional regulator n=1 Tax=Streptomyces sp. TLI_171 TaxID=1938859 RepID=UPI000C178A12|nr:LacI family DNA-binding transcriptional regulator [Streptomyces sp. TLI_171]RKE23422.1 LacI family transcriptional regulator [Streptomyces sp. TLI_171]